MTRKTQLDTDDIDRYCAALKASVKAGSISFMSSPVEPLLEAVIDFATALGIHFREGREAEQDNPDLRFLDEVDELNNPRQVQTRKRKHPWKDLLTAEVFRQLAVFATAVKRRQNTTEALRCMLVELSTHFPGVHPGAVAKSQKKAKTLVETKVKAFFRRQRERGPSTQASKNRSKWRRSS